MPNNDHLLKPCPFCDKPVTMKEAVGMYWIQCDHCKMEAAFQDCALGTITSWNSRPTEVQLAEARAMLEKIADDKVHDEYQLRCLARHYLKGGGK